MDSYQSREPLDAKGFWVLFAITQTAGVVAILSGNVHTFILPRLVGFGLLLPGILIGFLIKDPELPTWATLLIAIPVNAAVWYLTRRLLMFARKKMGLE
jgi:hypothetical protein